MHEEIQAHAHRRWRGEPSYQEGARVAPRSAAGPPAYSWWRNVVGGADVSVRLDGRWIDGRAQLLKPSDEGYDEAVSLHVAMRGPRMLRGLGVRVTDAGQVPANAREAAPGHAHKVRIDLERS